MQAAIGYLRVSTQEQGRSGLGLAAQRRDVEAFGAREGFSIKSWYQHVQTGAGADIGCISSLQRSAKIATTSHCISTPHLQNKSDKAAPVAARHEIVLFGHVLSKAIRWGAATVNPVRGMDFGKRAEKRAQVTMDQVNAVRDLANDRIRVAIDLAVSTGQRRGDLLLLKRDQLTDEGIIFRQSKTGGVSDPEAQRAPLLRPRFLCDLATADGEAREGRRAAVQLPFKPLF